MKNMKRNVSVLLAMVMVLAMMVVPAFGATGVFAMLTLPSSDFTNVVSVGTVKTLTVTGLTSEYAPVDVPDPSLVSWAKTGNIKFVESPTSDTEVLNPTGVTVYVKTTAEGDGTATATYNGQAATSVPANFVAEGASHGNVGKVKIRIFDPDNPTQVQYESSVLTVASFKTTLYITPSVDPSYTDENVLKRNPSVLHALLQGLAENNKPMPTVTSGGSYIQTLLGKDAYYDWVTGDSYGWEYTVSGIDPDARAAAIYMLHDAPRDASGVIVIDFHYQKAVF